MHLSLSWHFLYPSWTYFGSHFGNAVEIHRYNEPLCGLRPEWHSQCLLTAWPCCLRQCLPPPPFPFFFLFVCFSMILVRRIFPHGAKLIFDVIANRDCFQVHILNLMISHIINYRIAFKPLIDFELKDLFLFRKNTYSFSADVYCQDCCFTAVAAVILYLSPRLPWQLEEKKKIK